MACDVPHSVDFFHSRVLKQPGLVNHPLPREIASQSLYRLESAGHAFVCLFNTWIAVVYNHWTGTVNWNGGMEWWNCNLAKMRSKGHNIVLF